MKKFLLLLIAISCVVMVSPQLVSAQPSMPWFAAQHRIYEGGLDITKVLIRLENLTKDQIGEIRFIEPGSPTPSPLVTQANAIEVPESSIGAGYFRYWDWESVINAIESEAWNDSYYLVWNLSDHTLVEGGTYEIQVDYDTGTLSSTFVFSEYYPLPTVSLVSKKDKIKKGGGNLDVEELADGSLVLRWNAPAITHENTSARVFVNLEVDPDVDVLGGYSRYIIFVVPTHMGMLIMPSEGVQALTECAYYNGYFDFRISTRINDNSERTVSNIERYYP